MPSITLRQLEIFSETVRQGSFRRCAEHFGVSPVAISDHIRELEARLGYPLFERTPGGPSRLTSAGRRAYERVRSVLQQIDDLASDLAGEVPERLLVGTHPYSLRYLQPRLSDLTAQPDTPKIEVDLGIYTAAMAAEAIERRQADLAFFYSLTQPESPASTLVRIEPLAIFVGKTHPLAALDRVTVADLNAVPAVRLVASSPLQQLVAAAMAPTGIHGSRTAIESDNFGLILSSLARNLGFACMFASSGTDDVFQLNLVPLRVAVPLPALEVRAAHGPRLAENPRLATLAEELTRLMSANEA